MRWKKSKHDPAMWKRWFAWHPVDIEEGQVAWLEIVERLFRGYDYSGSSVWIYRSYDRKEI